MTHVIIGLSDSGARCLSLVNDLCVANASATQLGSYVFFHVNGKEYLPFVGDEHRFTLSENMPSDVMASMRDVLKSAMPKGDQETIDAVSKEPSRRYYSTLFKSQSSVFFDAVDAVLSQEKEGDNIVFHLVASISDVASTAMITEILLTLFHKYPQSRLFLYLFCSLPANVSEVALASMYAVLLEYSMVRSDRIYFFTYQDYIDVDQSEDEVCAQQIYSIINVTSLNIGQVGALGEVATKHTSFLTMEEKIFSVDMPTLSALLSRQCALGLIEQILMNDASQFSSLPWIENLLEEKKWLLHMDFLSMDQEVNQNEKQEWVRVEQEWASRLHFFLDEQKEDQSWFDQVSNIANSLNAVAQRYFRGRGIGLFYTVNDSGVSAMAKRIALQIETALLESWQQENGSLMSLLVWVDEVIVHITRRLSMCRNRRTQQCAVAKDELKQYRDLMEKWQEAGRMGQKRIERQNPVENMTAMLERHYVADCHDKAMTYACKLLLSVLEELSNSKEHLEALRNQIRQRMRAENAENLSVSVNKKYTSFFKSEWQIVPGAGSWGVQWLPELGKNTGLLNSVIEQMSGALDTEKGFVAMPSLLEDEKLLTTVARRIVQKYPILRGNENNVEPTLFWQAMRIFLSDFPEVFSQVLGEASANNEGEFCPTEQPIHFCLLPPNNEDKTLIDGLIHQCQQMLPESKILNNIRMGVPQIIFRQIGFMGITDFQGLDKMRMAYDQLIFAPNGAVWSLLLHTQTNLPYPDYESKIFPNQADAHDLRQQLLWGEICGVVKEAENSDIYLILGNIPIRLGKHFPDAQESINSWRAKLLKAALHNAKNSMTQEQIQQYLQKRLAQVQTICLNGKTDLSHADWQEAGRYVAWARASEVVLKQLESA